ncbi:MAG TPA: sorbosone dehydrogenase family protein [Crenotrichaceae bacterium]|nr:sorbosone dehydrogenase family protein [Crenotrichaceae bacterium]
MIIQSHMTKICLLLATLFPFVVVGQPRPDWLKQITLPDGFNISIYADDVENARSLALGNDGVVYVGTLRAGNVYALRDTDGDGVADQRFVIAHDLTMPNGVTVLNGALYVATVTQLLRWKHPSANLEALPKPEVLVNDFPDDERHGWRYLKAGPDKHLYVTIGAPCNVCKKPKPVYATIMRMNAEGGEREIFAKGVRNSVGMDWHPQTAELFFNENGRDMLGDDIPPDELNHAPKTGMHFGFPYCHGVAIADEKYGKKKPCHQLQSPAWSYPAHIAPLGLHFYRGKSFPIKYQGQAFVAQHGSWNRTVPHGYRIAMLQFKNNQPLAETIFAEGWLLADGEVLGRPVDILELHDGSLLVSDDKRGVIYRITYTEEK